MLDSTADLVHPRSAEAAVLRGQGSTLVLHALTHELQTVIKHFRHELAGQHDFKTGHMALIFCVCTNAYFVLNKIIYKIQFSCYLHGD